jgi:hypothetical protein
MVVRQPTLLPKLRNPPRARFVFPPGLCSRLSLQYRLIRERLPNTTLLSVGHRTTLCPFHTRRVVVQPDGNGPARIVEIHDDAERDENQSEIEI